MATTSKTTGKTKSGSRKSSSSRSSGSGSRTAQSRSNAKRGTQSRTTAKSATTSRPTAKNGGGSKERIAQLASKARLPLIAGGAAVVSAAAGVAAQRHASNRSTTVGKLRGLPSTLSPGKNLAKLDLDKMKAAGERMSALGQQTVDIANAVEKTRKKNK